MKALALLISLMFAAEALAVAPYGFKGQNQPGVQYSNVLQFPNNQVTKLNGINSLVETGNRNLLANPEFESVNYSAAWVVTGAATVSEELVNPLNGRKSFKAVMLSNNIEIYQDTNLYAGVLGGTQGYVNATCSNTAPSATICARFNGVVGTGNSCITLATDGRKKDYEIPIVFGSTSTGVEVYTTGSVSGTLICDNMEVSDKPRTPEVAQAQLAFSGYFATTASAVTTDTGTSLATPAVIAAIPGPTVLESGVCSLQTTDANRFEWTANNCPPGKYVVRANPYVGTSGAATACLRITDGTTNGRSFCQLTNTTTSANAYVEAEFTYTSSGNRTFTIQVAAASGSVSMDASASLRELKFSATYYPPASAIYSQPCNDPRQCENEFSANLDSAGTVSGENLDFINGNAASGGTGIKTVTWNTGIFTADPNCVLTVVGGSSASNELHIEISASSSTSLTYETASTGADANFAAKLVCQKSPPDYKAQNQITGTFANVVTAPGISKPKTCYYAFGQSGATLAAPTECSSGPCGEVYDSCGAITPPAGGTGLYTDLTIANGTYAASTPLRCDCAAYDTTSTQARDCRPYFITGDQTWSTNSSGGALLNFVSTDTDGIAQTAYVILECTGQAP